MEVQLTKLFQNGRIKYHPSRDVGLIKIGTPEKLDGKKFQINLGEGLTIKQGKLISGLDKNNVKLFSDVLVGNTVFAFGYPSSIAIPSPWLDVTLPLLRKGIIAGKNTSLKVIIIDCLCSEEIVGAS